MATIEFLGAVGTVTGSKFLVEAEGRRLPVGMAANPNISGGAL